MEVRRAILQVSEIREHLARTEKFHGYRSLTVGFTGLVGIVAAVNQASWPLQPSDQLRAYLGLWTSAAALNLAIVAVEVWSRARSADSSLERRNSILAVEQFLPSLVAGGLLTLIIALRASESAWMLPGLWALVFSLGIFASCWLLSRAIAVAGTWYFVGGILVLAWGRGFAMSPWVMGVIFGGGQILTALILHFTLERADNR